MRIDSALCTAGWIILLLAAGCAAPRADWQRGSACTFDETTFNASFPGGRLTACRQTGPRAYTLAIEPEAQPINPSPWYAFDVAGDAPQMLEITLDYGEFRHRYAPKVRAPDGSGWTPLQTSVTVHDDGTRATFTFAAPAGTSRIAAQEIVTPADAQAWIDAVAATSPLQACVLGTSAENRPIRCLAGGRPQAGTLVVTGRQHPPEVTGVFALRAFVERLAAGDPLAKRFRDAYGIFVLPMLNPDGVVHGHWRLDSAGTDLNRDWGPFTRPETRIVRDVLPGLGPVLIVDFHSTTRDVLYTPPDDADIARAWLAPAWHTAIDTRLDGEPLARDAAHNPHNPTLKSWAPQALGIPAVTFEVGDATPRERIDTMARIAAEEAMRLLLSDGHR